MPSNAKDYAAFLRKQARELPAAVYMPRFRRVAFRVVEIAAQLSPVNFGTLRNGWHVTIGSPSGTEVEAGKSLAGVLAAAQSVINRTEFGQAIWIQNNTPYARVYEDGLFVPPDPGPSKATHVPKSRRKRVEGTVLIRGGYHVSAPNGMLRDAVQQVAEELAAGVL